MHRSAKKSGRFARGLMSVCGTTIVLALAALAVALALVPKVVGGAALTVLTGSMQPSLAPGDMIVVAGVDDAASEIAVGDVVTFMPYPDDPTLVTHRVVGKSVSAQDGVSFITQGDANSAEDDPIGAHQIRGRFLYAVPYVGYVTTWFSAKAPWLATAAGVSLIGYGLFCLVRGAPRRAHVPAPPSAAAAVTGF
ncbi:MAG: signal peptidase I [Bifidobacteriaceae bacterium]|jgi:signal peptidase|nr:signal peptidase I [Bifidobacteriaceae bacterium]